MANPEDLEKLCQGPEVWNAWRAENVDRIPDLRDARLTLCQRQFGPSHGGPVDLICSELEGAELRHATLTGAKLERANLNAADLVHAKLDQADLRNADLTDAVLDYADLSGANLDGAILVGASFSSVRGLTADQIANAHGDASTVLPGGMLPPASWFPPLEEDMFAGSPAPDEPIHDSDPYHVLGVEPTATHQEIRTAFRSLVKMFHPDLNPGNAEAQEMFKRISIAYRILGDAEKRARYDRGEIGGDGEVSPEFEARQQFRRHAYRFYAAAAASLLIAIGALFSVWYMVLVEDRPQGYRLRIAVDTPIKLKSDGRLIADEPPTIEKRPSQEVVEVPNPETNGVSVAPEETVDLVPEQEAPAPAAVTEADGEETLANAQTASSSPATDKVETPSLIAASASRAQELSKAAEPSDQPEEKLAALAEDADLTEEAAVPADKTPVPDPAATSIVNEQHSKAQSPEPDASSLAEEKVEHRPPHDSVAALTDTNEAIEPQPEQRPPHDSVNVSRPSDAASSLDANATEVDKDDDHVSGSILPTPSSRSEILLLRSIDGRSLSGSAVSAIFQRVALQHISATLHDEASKETQAEIVLFSSEPATNGPLLRLQTAPMESASPMVATEQSRYEESAQQVLDRATRSGIHAPTRLAQDNPSTSQQPAVAAPEAAAATRAQQRQRAISDILAGGL